MSCWENPETCRGCPYCVGGEDDCGRRHYSDFTPIQARRVELEHEAERALKSARLAAQVRADLADKRRDDNLDADEPSAFRQWQQDVTA